MYYKLIFYLSLFMGTLMSISSNSWMGMWMGLEINLLSIIPLISNNFNLMNSEASIKYFITQAIASTIFLFSIIMLSIIMTHEFKMNYYLLLTMNSALMLKMGAAPFHFWFPEIMEGLSWINSIIMLTWQKIAPMIILMYSNFNLNYLNFSILACMIISGIQGINQTNMRKILAYSSINHVGWMMASIMFLEMTWTIYFMIYSIITLNLAWIFNKFNIFHLKQLIYTMNKNITMKFFFMLNFLSLGGLPPFLGFFPKWLTIQIMIENNLIALTFIMIMMTLLTLFFYMRITFSTITLQMNENPTNVYSNTNSSIWMINWISLSGLILSTMLMNLT